MDDELVRHLLAEQFPALSKYKVERVNTPATVNSIFRIGSEYVARLPLASTSVDELKKEVEAFNEFSQIVPFSVPSPIAIGAPSDQYDSAWSIFKWLPGDVTKPGELPAGGALVMDIVSLISTLRSCEVRDRFFEGPGRGGELEAHDAWVEECCAKGSHIIDSDRVWLLWQKFHRLPRLSPDVMSHKDLTPFNLLIRSNRLAGVLDCGNFGPADPALDLVVAWHLFEFDDREIIRRELNVADIEWRRGAAWALVQAIGLVWYYETSNPEMSRLGISTIQRILDAEG